MRKSLKIPLIILGVVISIVLGAILIIPIVVDPNDYKSEIATLVEEKTGRKLHIEGDLKLQILPKLAVTSGKLSLGNRKGFDGKTFAQVDHAYFRIRLIPLFSKQVRIKKIVLHGLDVRLIRRNDQQTNWQDLTAPKSSSGKRSIPIRYQNVQPGREALESPLAALVGTKIDILDSHIHLDDHASGNQIQFQNIEFILGRFGFDKSVYVSLKGTLHHAKPKFSETLEIAGHVIVNDTMTRIGIPDFQWISELDNHPIAEQFRHAQLSAAADIDLAKHTLNLKGFRLTSDQTSIGANLNATNIFETPVVNGSISMDQINPVKFLRLAGIDYTPKDPSALQSLTGKLTLALNDPRLDLRNIQLVLDGNPIKGSALVTNFKSPNIKFNFSADQFNGDRYLTESNPSSATSTPQPATEVSVTEEKASSAGDEAEQSSGTSFQGILNLGGLHFLGLHAEQVQLALNGNKGVVRCNQRFKKFYKGRFKGSIEYNYGKEQPIISLNQRLSDVAIGPLLTDYQGHSSIEGTLQAGIRLVGRGAHARTFKSTLNGDVDAVVKNGQFSGLDLAKAIRDIKDFLPGSQAKTGAAGDFTKFSKLKYKATINNGVVDNTLLEAKSKNFDVNGNGKVYLANDAVDYRINAAVTDNPEGVAGVKIKELQGVRVPIRIGGYLGKLTYQPDVKQALKDPKIKAVAEKLKRKAHKKLGAGARELLNNLF